MMKTITKFKPYILGIIGPIASGKDAAADYLAKRYGFKKIVLSNFLRQEAKERGIYPSREYLRKLQAELRKKNGNDFLLKKAMESIEKNHYERAVIDGLRQYDECLEAKKKFKAKIILLDADPLARFMRAKKRGRKGFSHTYEQFLHQDAIESALFRFHETKKLADFRINNKGDMKDMQKDMDKIAKKLKIKKKL